MLDVTASIVLYRNPRHPLITTIESFLNTRRAVKLLLIDNSPTDALRELGNRDRCEYIFNNRNLGFGKAHNAAIRSVLPQTRYHLVLNPDVIFGAEVVEALLEYMDNHPETGLAIPRVINFAAEVQHIARRLPRPTDLLLRRLGIKSLNRIFARQLRHYEMQDKDYNVAFEAPSLSGCFMFFRAEALQKAGLFDERFFMYLEDIDISRRVHRIYKTVYYPAVQIQHGHARESYHWNRLMFTHVLSAIKYFTKWGWFFDPERTRFNDEPKQ